MAEKKTDETLTLEECILQLYLEGKTCQEISDMLHLIGNLRIVEGSQYQGQTNYAIFLGD